MQQKIKIGLSTTDKTKMATDITNAVHNMFQGIKQINTFSALTSLKASERAYLYYVTDTAEFASWNGTQWINNGPAFGNTLTDAIAKKTSEIRFVYDEEGYPCYVENI